MAGVKRYPGYRNVILHTEAGVAYTAGGGSGTTNKTAINVREVTVAVAGTAVTGPDVAVPNGFALVVQLRITQAGNQTGYVGEAADVPNIPVARRKEIKKGMALKFFVQNMNQIGVDASVNGTVFEFYAEKS